MIGFAVVFGLLAVFIAQVWLNNQASMQARNYEANKKTMTTRTTVVPKQPLRFGTDLNPAMLQEVPWPAEAGLGVSLPAGQRGWRRPHGPLRPAIEANEP